MSLDDVKRKGMISEIISRLSGAETDIRKLFLARSSPYPTLNENSPAQLTASVDNYGPGLFGALRMSSNAAWNITGLSSGTKGRLLQIYNVGAQNIVLVHASGSSLAENRITSPTGANITLGANDSATLYYDSTSLTWRVQAYSL